MSRILLAEDSPRIASFVTKGLQAHGLTVLTVADGRKVGGLALSGEFDLLILDVGLPGKDGFAILREIRNAGSQLPVLILSARDSVADKVAGLESGADDYMAKPFSFQELLARVRKRLERVDGQSEPVIGHAGVTLNLLTRRVSVNGVQEDLTAREFALLEMFLRHPGQVLAREQLLSTVWGYDYDPGSNVVDVYVRYLRKKLGPDSIETVRGMGYRFGG